MRRRRIAADLVKYISYNLSSLKPEFWVKMPEGLCCPSSLVSDFIFIRWYFCICSSRRGVCILIINHILKDYVNEQGTKMVLLHLVVLVEVLVKANLAYSAIPFSLSRKKLESISTSFSLS